MPGCPQPEFADGRGRLGRRPNPSPQPEHSPASPLPAGGIKAVAAVDNDAGPHPVGQIVGVEVDELLPFGEYQHGVGSLAGLGNRDRVVQRGKQSVRVVQGLGVIDIDRRTVEL